MHRTLTLQKGGRMISAKYGQRRILKRKLPLIEYIEKAVNTGIYRTTEEIHEAVKAVRRGDVNKREPQVAAERFRKDVIRGTNVQDYPAEYHILKLYPPIPKPPRIPKKMERKMERARPKHPTENLIKHYMQRASKHNATTEDYYHRLLGIEPPAENYAMGQKSASITKAYAYAVKQYEVMRTQDVSEKEALAIVDQLLEEENKEEGHTSRAHTEQVKEWKQQQRQPEAASTEDSAVPANLPSILHDRPRVAQGMLEWSRMLQTSGIPYSEWTVGASTALDHWIARNILDLSESTWQALLEGNNPNLLSRGQDIVVVRETLFPETRTEVEDTSDEFLAQQEDEERMRAEQAAMSFQQPQPPVEEEPDVPKGKSVDELLQSLRGLTADDAEEEPKEEEAVPGWSFKDNVPAGPEPPQQQPEKSKDDGPRDAIQMLTDELQEWRAINVQSPYDQWPEAEKQRFTRWMERYLTMLTTETDRPLIDLDETRIALLSSPPLSEEESDNFWDKIKDETKSDIFLQNLLKEGPPEGLPEDEKIFWTLPYEAQLEKLVNLGTLRPLMDDYISDSERVDFMRRYGDYLLEGVELDHLIPDPQGTITGMDLGAETIRAWGIQHQDRFSLVKLPYKAGLTGNNEEDDVEEGETGRDLAMERSRALYQAWNKQKAGRARYEEQMFVQGDLGLSYDSKTENEMEDERMEAWKYGDENPVIDRKKPKNDPKKKK